MVLWISVGLIAGSVLVLTGVAVRTLRRLGDLRRAVRRAQLQQGDLAAKTRTKITDLQAGLELLQLRTIRTNEQLALLKAARDADRQRA
jgi:hypothetical protein